MKKLKNILPKNTTCSHYQYLAIIGKTSALAWSLLFLAGLRLFISIMRSGQDCLYLLNKKIRVITRVEYKIFTRKVLATI